MDAFETQWRKAEGCTKFVKYLSENWFGRMETLVRSVVDSHSGTPMDVPTTSNAIESYHGHMKQGQLARKCVPAPPSAPPPCCDACAAAFSGSTSAGDASIGSSWSCSR